MLYGILYCKKIFHTISLASVLEISDLQGNEQSLEQYPERSKVQNNIQADILNIISHPDTVFTRNDEKHTSFDLQELRWHFKTDQSVLNYFSQWFGIGLTRNSGFLKVNNFYQSVIEMYESRYLRKVPDSLKVLSFSSVKDIRNFLNGTGEGRLGIYRCELVKLFLSYARSSTEKSYSQIKNIHKQINARIYTPFAIEEEKVSGSTIVDSKFMGESNGVNFHGYTRYKSLPSIVGKEVANSDYNSLADFKDLHGYTFECNNKKDILLILQQFFHSHILEDMEIENKHLIQEDDIQSHDGLDDEFKVFLLGEIQKSKKIAQEKQSRKGSSQSYKEIKIRGKARYTDPENPNSQDNWTGVEVKFQLENNTNEYGKSFHGILDLKKRFRELTRLSTIVRLKDVVNFVNDFFDRLEGELQLKGKNLEQYIPELIQDFQEEGILKNSVTFNSKTGKIPKALYQGLFDYLERDLVKVKKNKRSKKWYYVHNTYITKSEAGIVPNVEEI